MPPQDIAAILSSYNIKIPSLNPGRYYTTCPWCSLKRKPHHRRLRVLGVTITEQGLSFGCNHCHITGPMTGARDALPHYGYDTSRKIRHNGQFQWEHRDQTGTWHPGTLEPPKLYRIAEARECGGTVLVCEGEKDVDNLWNIGFAATCHPHGAGNWTAEHSTQLEGLAVVVLNDNDEPGYRYAQAAVKHSIGVARSVRRLDLKDYWPQIGPGEDVSDWLDHGGGSEEWLERIIADLPEINGHGRQQDTPAETFHSTKASEFKMKAIQWLWPNRFALGKLGLISGLPDEGKGQLLWFIAAQATNGGQWPCGEGEAMPGNVLVLQCEDDPRDTVAPRLAAAGADLDKVYLASMVRDGPNGRMFNIARDLELLRNEIKRIGGVTAVLIDPLSAYLGSKKDVDTFRTSDVRSVLSPFATLAAELNTAIVSILHFNKKADVNNVLLRVSDSSAFTAQCRHLYGVINDEENDRKLLVRGKNNLASGKQQSLAYRFSARRVGIDEDSGQDIWAPFIMFDPEGVDIDPNEAMAGLGGRPRDERDKIKDWLRAKLAMGETKLSDLKKAWDAEGFSKATIYRAKDEIGAVSRCEDGTYYWALPAKPEKY